MEEHKQKQKNGKFHDKSFFQSNLGRMTDRTFD